LLLADVVVVDAAASTAFVLLLARNGSAVSVTPVTASTPVLAPGFPATPADVDFLVDGALEGPTVYTALYFVHVALSTNAVGVFSVGLGPCLAGR